MTNPFDNPGSFDGIEFKEHLGALLIIDVHGVESAVKTKFGESDAVRSTVTVADGPGVGTVYADALIFPRALVSQLKSKVGRKVLGRLAQGVASQGQSPPWLLLDPTAQDTQLGVDFLNRQSLGGPAQPAQEPTPQYQQQGQPQGGYNQPQGQAPQHQQYPDPSQAQQVPQGYGPPPQGYPAGPAPDQAQAAGQRY